jgi:cytochrome b6-f complex iron-sulfur subunit
MKRRKFVTLIGTGSVMPMAIAACSSQQATTPVSEGTPRSDGFTAVGTVADLNTKGQILVEDGAKGKVLVVPDPVNSSQVIAVNPTCTHAGCTVAWQKDQKLFVCPCHNSQFSGDGKVTKGPAGKPIPTYTAKIEADSVLVKLT